MKNLVTDYKTDKKSDNASVHKRQLAVYKKMLSILEEIPEEDIKRFKLAGYKFDKALSDDKQWTFERPQP